MIEINYDWEGLVENAHNLNTIYDTKISEISGGTFYFI